MKATIPDLSKQLKFREAWAYSTDTPLRFFVHILFVIESALSLVIVFGFFTHFDKAILFMMVLSLIGMGVLTLILLFILVAFFPKNLVFDKQAHLFEKALEFGDESHVIAYKQLLESKPTEAPLELTHKKEEEK
jgi:hypothetical protein